MHIEINLPFNIEDGGFTRFPHADSAVTFPSVPGVTFYFRGEVLTGVEIDGRDDEKHRVVYDGHANYTPLSRELRNPKRRIALNEVKRLEAELAAAREKLGRMV